MGLGRIVWFGAAAAGAPAWAVLGITAGVVAGAYYLGKDSANKEKKKK